MNFFKPYTIWKATDVHEKGWGYEYWVANTEKYCGKILVFNKGKKCSWHYHKLKDETFFVHEGYFLITTGYDDDILVAQERVLGPGESMHVPFGLRHQIYAVSDAILYEFSTEHFEEDSYRIIKGD